MRPQPLSQCQGLFSNTDMQQTLCIHPHTSAGPGQKETQRSHHAVQCPAWGSHLLQEDALGAFCNCVRNNPEATQENFLPPLHPMQLHIHKHTNIVLCQ